MSLTIDHTGRRALVTGAASGIGRLVSLQLAAAGAEVVAVDRDGDGLARLAGEVEGLETVTCDLSDRDAVLGLPTDIDILINNAGLQHISPIQDFPLEKFDLLMQVLLHAPYYLIRQCVPHMYAKNWGRIVNISSVHGLRASAYKSAYVTAKHGLEGLSKTVALEGGPHGVTSVTVNPAYVRTPLVESQIADQAKIHGISEDEVVEKIMLTPIALKRLVEPEEVADLVTFLTGPAGASMTGSSYAMDGGWTAH